MRLEISGPDYEMLCKALVAAYNASSLEQMLQFRLGLRMDLLVPAHVGFDYAVFTLIKQAEMEGWTSELVLQSITFRPKDTKLYDIAVRLGISPGVAPESQGVLGASAGGWLQSLVDPVQGFLNVAEVIGVLAERQRQVCLIEIDGAARGTGFLVGPNRVLTNHHVVKQVIEDKIPPSSVKLRFDYWRAAKLGAQPQGMVCSLVSANRSEAIPHHSPPTDEESKGKQSAKPPEHTHLDYALLITAGAPGNIVVDNVGAADAPHKRGWIVAGNPPSEPGPNDTLIILQHPQAAPLSLAWNTPGVVSKNTSGTRVKYLNNTSPGSSGSPCFNGRFQIVALHHSGNLQAAAGAAATIGNEGIPIKAVIDSLRARGETVALS